jgi:hypothetical protein
MLTTVLVLFLVFIIIAAVLIVGFMGYVRIQDRKKRVHPPAVGKQIESPKVDKCAGCGEQRIIVSQDDTLCAACYSALRTKKLG